MMRVELFNKWDESVEIFISKKNFSLIVYASDKTASIEFETEEFIKFFLKEIILPQLKEIIDEAE